MRAPIESYLPDWQSIDIRAIAVRAKGGRWAYNSIRVVLDPEPTSSQEQNDPPKIENLLVAHEKWKISRLDELLTGLLQGDLHVAGETVMVQSFNGSEWRTERPLPPTLVSEKGLSRYGVDFPSYVTEWQSSMSGAVEKDVSERIERSLRTNDPPWDGIGELRENYVGLQDWNHVGYDWSRLDFVAPLYVKLDSVRVEGDIVHLNVAKTKLTRVEDMTISLIGIKGPQTTDRRVEKVVGKYKSDAKLEENFKLSGKPSRLKIFLGYRGIAVDSRTVFILGALARPSLHVLEFMGISRLSDLVSSNGEDLERGVALLFHNLGFDTANYARRFDDSTDIVAFGGPQGPVLVIECTGGVLNSKDKLSKLIKRTRELAEKVPGVEFRPVIFTSLRRDSLSESNKEDARKDRIIVVTSDDVPKLLQMISEATNADQAIRFLEGLLGSPFG